MRTAERLRAVSDVVIAGAARTAVGAFGGSLRGVPPSTLGATAARGALERAGVDPGEVECVVFGNVIPTEPRDLYMARVVGIETGVPQAAPALTVNRLCASGVQAIACAAQAIQAGEARIALAGGAEAMSRGAFWTTGPRWGARTGTPRLVDSVAGALTDPFDGEPLGHTAERLARRAAISRERQDAFAASSHRRAAAAQVEGRCEREIVPVEVTGRRGAKRVDVDERVRTDVSAAALGELAPAFETGGTVTAGNASGLADAGAALVLMSAEEAKGRGAPVLGRILAHASCGIDPRIMGMAPVPATRAVLTRAGRALDEVGVVELSEAFAAQALAVIDELRLDEAKVNPNGGAIALGHPVAATGAVLAVKLLSEMECSRHELGLVTLCAGGGQGIAMLIARD